MSESSPECAHRLWIGNIGSQITEFKLLKMVEKFGPLSSYDFMYHRFGPLKGKPRGFAFITFKEPLDAEVAMHSLDGLIVSGCRLVAKWSNSVEEGNSKEHFAHQSKTEESTMKLIGKKKDIKSQSAQTKITAIEEQLKLLEAKNGDLSFNPDVGGSSRPTYVTYNYINSNHNSNNDRSDYRNSKKQFGHPYQSHFRGKRK